MGDVQECKEVWQEWHRAVCKVCRAGGRKAADKFHFKDVKLECVYEFAYLGDMLNDTGGVEQAVAARVRAAWMKFREFGGILCTRGASLRMKGVVFKCCVQIVKGKCSQRVDVWGRDLGDESRGVSETASHREENA